MLRRILKRILLPPMIVIAAVVMFAEEWLWNRLTAAMARLAKAPIFRRMEAWLSKLPPYAAAAAFLLPGTLLLPVKLSALYLATHGHPVGGVGVIVAAKVVGTACVARLYSVCKPALLSLGWFRWGHDKIIWLKGQLYGAIKAMPGWAVAVKWKNRIRLWMPRGGHFPRQWRAVGEILRKRFFRKKL